MNWYNIISIAAVIVGPIASVWISQRLQIRQAKRKDKLELFMTLMMSRTGWTLESVKALNVLDIVFADDENVRGAWKTYYDRLCVENENPTPTEAIRIQEAQYDLLETMANSLGYKNKITWKTIQKPYKPRGMFEYEQNQREYQEGQLAIAKLAKSFESINFPNSPMLSQEQNRNEVL